MRKCLSLKEIYVYKNEFVYVCPLCTAKRLMKFFSRVILTVGKVCNTVLGSYPSSRDHMKRNKSKYDAKLKMADHAVAILCFFVDDQPLYI